MDSNQEIFFEHLVIGSGLAGLSSALMLAEKCAGEIAVVTKGAVEDCNSRLAQGGIACVTDQEDSFDEHIADTINAGLDLVEEGVANYTTFYRNGYDSLLVELGKHGMTKRDFTEIINFFSKVVVDEKGAMTFLENNSKPGDYVDLRAEIDTLVILDTGMHPLSTATEYPRKPIKATVYRCEPGTKEDPCFTWCPENERGFLATELYNA